LNSFDRVSISGSVEAKAGGLGACEGMAGGRVHLRAAATIGVFGSYRVAQVLTRRLVVAAIVSIPFAAHGQDGPIGPIRSLNDALLALMQKGAQVPFAQRMQTLTPIVQRAFDLPQILRNSVGLRWNGIPAAQQEELLNAFIQFTVASYVANFDNYSNERFEIDPRTRAIRSEQVVQTRIVPTTGDPTRIDYVMHLAEGGVWKAVDVLLDGSISRVAVQRSDFRSLLASGDPARLIDSLREKIARYAAGGKY